MRLIKRLELDNTTKRKLQQKQDSVNTKKAAGTLNETVEWEQACKTKPLDTVLSTLKSMAGKRELCMYCLESHGTDREHFWPKSKYPERMFLWQNLLLCCTECGRCKGSKFPIKDGEALLIDPTIEEPWQYLDFDPKTGNIIERFLLSMNQFSERGKVTVEILQLKERESLSTGHRITYRRLKDHVETFLKNGSVNPSEMIDKLMADDKHNLLGWCAYSNGGNVEPFKTLRLEFPNVWESLIAAVISAKYIKGIRYGTA